MKIRNEATLHDIRLADAQLLDESELDAVIGGTDAVPDDDRYEDKCVIDYCCWYGWHHPDDTQPGDSCFWDYSCAVVIKYW